MLNLYRKLNKTAFLIVWMVVLLGALAALPLAFNRIETERSSDNVSFVFDYHDLLQIAQYKSDPQAYIHDQLVGMKQAGFNAMAVYESTLSDLHLNGRIEVYNSRDIALMTNAKQMPQDNSTYVLFSDSGAKDAISPLIRQGFADYGVAVNDWSFQGKQGLTIAMPTEESEMKPLDPDPLTMQNLHDLGFQIIPRLSDARPFNQAHMNDLLAGFERQQIKWLLFTGDRVTGVGEDGKMTDLPTMAELMKRHGIGAVVIEPLSLKVAQQGIEKLSYLLGYNVVRLHSVLENEASTDPVTLSDRYVLAVTDRNIRMIYLNADAKKDPYKAAITDPIDNLEQSLTGPDGAEQRLESMGYSIASPNPFTFYHSSFDKPLRLIAATGAVALIALTIAEFFPLTLLIFFILGLIGSAGLYVVSSTLLVQALALGAGVSAASLSVIMAIRRILSRPVGDTGFNRGFWQAVGLFLQSVLVSLMGVLLIVGLLNQAPYMLQLNLFRGVSLLHVLPIMIIGFYVLFFAEGFSLQKGISKIKRLLFMNITLLWVVLAGLFGLALLFYMSRTGNAGHTLPFERVFRSYLENTLGVRPRTKEFLFAHPIYILGAFIAFKYRQALYLFVIGVIGQLSILDTSAHIHTPLLITLTRIVYGVLGGIVISLIYIAVWRLAEKWWNKWKIKLVQS